DPGAREASPAAPSAHGPGRAPGADRRGGPRHRDAEGEASPRSGHQGPARDRVLMASTEPTILFLSTADTDLLALSYAVADLPDGFPAARAANPATVATTE